MNQATANALRNAHLAVRTSTEKTLEHKARLLIAIKRARDEAWTYEDIAEHLEISPSRVQQLVRQADGRGRSSR